MVFPTQPTPFIWWSSRVKSLRISFNLAWCFSGILDSGRMPSESGSLRKQESVDLVVRGETQNKNHAKSQKRRNSESHSRQVRLHQPFQRKPTSADVVVVGQSWRHNTQENQAQGGRMHFSVVVRSFSPYVVDLAVLEACVEAEISQEEGVVGKRYLLYSGQGGESQSENNTERQRQTERKRDRERETLTASN